MVSVKILPRKAQEFWTPDWLLFLFQLAFDTSAWFPGSGIVVLDQMPQLTYYDDPQPSDPASSGDQTAVTQEGNTGEQAEGAQEG